MISWADAIAINLSILTICLANGETVADGPVLAICANAAHDIFAAINSSDKIAIVD